jgi:hypothetical protein
MSNINDYSGIDVNLKKLSNLIGNKKNEVNLIQPVMYNPIVSEKKENGNLFTVKEIKDKARKHLISKYDDMNEDNYHLFSKEEIDDRCKNLILSDSSSGQLSTSNFTTYFDNIYGGDIDLFNYDDGKYDSNFDDPREPEEIEELDDLTKAANNTEYSGEIYQKENSFVISDNDIDKELGLISSLFKK